MMLPTVRLHLMLLVTCWIPTIFGLPTNQETVMEEITDEVDKAIRKLEEEKLKEVPGVIRPLLGWRYSDRSMAYCTTDSDCVKSGYRMVCQDNTCGCKLNEILIENWWEKRRGCHSRADLFEPCLFSEQCIVMNRNTYCSSRNRCNCSHGYYYDGRECVLRYNGNLKAQEVYKAAVVAAACFIVAVVGIFVACIVRRSFCRRDRNGRSSESSRSNDVFTVSDEIAALRAVDKPPSYEEVLQIERTFYGIPPPEYTFARNSPPIVNSHIAPNYASNQENDFNQIDLQQNVPVTDNHSLNSRECKAVIEVNAKNTSEPSSGVISSIVNSIDLAVANANLHIPVSSNISENQNNNSAPGSSLSGNENTSPAGQELHSFAPSSSHSMFSTLPRLLLRHKSLLSSSSPSSAPASPHLSLQNSHSASLAMQQRQLLSSQLSSNHVTTLAKVNSLQSLTDCPSGECDYEVTDNVPSQSWKNEDGKSEESLILSASQNLSNNAYDNLGFVKDKDSDNNAD